MDINKFKIIPIISLAPQNGIVKKSLRNFNLVVSKGEQVILQDKLGNEAFAEVEQVESDKTPAITATIFIIKQ